ncbi:non-homologous end-joining DNA ligase [Rhizobium giardinii]|uniref:non-homologous end-joining DNA ligase n=1 Tax=Rhizobium giardinii TaxID=56731 RepID=UPI0039E0E6DC
MTKPPKPGPIGVSQAARAPLPRRSRNAPRPKQPRPDAMPARIDPCLATLVAKPPKGSDLAFEVKWDGYRVEVHIEKGGVRILTRGGHDWTDKFPSIAAEAPRLPVKTAILDGEAVVLDAQGRSDFGLLQRALGRRPASHEPGEILVYAFDLLYLDGRDLRRLPQRERRRLLEPLLEGRVGAIRLSEEMEADGEAFFRVACELGLEGIIAKHRARPYRSGKRPEWLKIKCIRRDNFVIVGFEPSTVPGAIGRLLLAAMKGGSPVYVGSVGTGFTRQSSGKLRELLEQIPTKTPAVKLGRKNATFTRPILAAEIEYRAWTEDRKLRHPSFKGLHEINDVATIYRIDE